MNSSKTVDAEYRIAHSCTDQLSGSIERACRRLAYQEDYTKESPCPGPWRTRRAGQTEGRWSASANVPKYLLIHSASRTSAPRGQGPSVLFTLYFLHLELNICGMPERAQGLELGRILSCTRYRPRGLG